METDKLRKVIRGEPGVRRAQILDEALRLVGDRGYYGFGLQELAGRCNMTKPGLLHHFGSKDRLLLELLRERDAANEVAAVASLQPARYSELTPGQARGSLLNTLRVIVERNAAQPELMRLQVILRAEAINHEHPAHDYFTSREDAKQGLLAEALEACSANPRGVARNVLALLGGLEQEWLREERGFDLVAESMAAITLLLAGEAALPSRRQDKQDHPGG